MLPIMLAGTSAMRVTAPRMQVAASATSEVAPPTTTVGQSEQSKFICDESVKLWEEFQKDGPATAADNLRETAAVFARIASTPQGAAYAAAAGLRSGYFATNAILGTFAFELSQRIKEGSEGGAGGLVNVAGFGNMGGLGVDGDIASRLLLEAALVYEADYAAVAAGEFKLPWDMATPTHRQYTPGYALRQTQRFVREAVGTLGRRSRQQPEDVGVWMGADEKLYPSYYLNNFHYQTDGWLSRRSAEVYETSTETLFVGRQDAMQRTSLRPLHAKRVAWANGGAPRVLEVACGTGRVATFLRDNLPASAELTAVDLSPFYLEKARENDAYWRRTRGKADGASMPPAARFVQANAESLPFEDGSFDAVVCVYLFHEMPKEARARAALEMCRVVAPGGTVVLTDSMQKGDRPVLDDQLGNFGKLNEPHYCDYIETDIGALFEAGGLTCDTKYVCSSSKTLSFTKPMPEDTEAAVASAPEPAAEAVAEVAMAEEVVAEEAEEAVADVAEEAVADVVEVPTDEVTVDDAKDDDAEETEVA